MKVVVVEDEIRIREGISRMLEKLDAGYELAGEAPNGREGLALLRQLRPEIVITDIRMPEMDGLEMLRAAYEEQIPVKAIVLSAYSDFEYARQAIKLGVTEYLLKPIMLGDFSRSLETAKKQAEEARMQQPEGMGTLEQLFYGLLWGNLGVDSSLLNYVEHKYGLHAEEPLIQICLYLGEGYEKHKSRIRKELDWMLSEQEGLSWCVLEAVYDQSLVVVIYRFQDTVQLERWFQYSLLNNRLRMDYHVGIGWIQTENLIQLRQRFKTLYSYMDWNITLGDEVMISYPKITRIQTVPCIYPIDIEKQIKLSICENDSKKTEKCMEQFGKHFWSDKLYAPKEIKECFVRFLWAVINTAKEVGGVDYQSLEQQRLLDSIMNARTRQELERTSEFLLSKLILQKEEEKETLSLAVKRAERMIEEFYQDGITLDEIAARLNLTPEYLGTQFHKEMGVNFSTYMRDFRIIKAKQLLLGTQLKLYEIAEQAGYSNPKYFSRVFRECTGQLPAEYRKTH